MLSGELGSVLGAIIEHENREDNIAEVLLSYLSCTVFGVYIHDVHNSGTRGKCIELDTMSSVVGSG